MPETEDDWLDEPRDHLLERFASVLERIVDVAVAQRDHGAAVRYAQTWVQHDPLVEEPYRRLMRLHALRDERAKAMHVYHSCASLLMREVGGEPSPRTQEAYEQVMLMAPDVVVPDVVLTADFARAGLAGEARRLEATSDARRLEATTDAARRVASTSAASFIGRAHDLAHLRTVWEQARAGRPALEFAPVAALLRGPALSATLADLAPLWRRELRRLLPEVADPREPPPDPLTEPWQRTRLFEAMARPVLARQRIVLMVDDLQ